MFIITQDRSEAVEYKGQIIYTMPVFHEKVLIAINLNISLGRDNSLLLGTFESVGECTKEISNIAHCKDDIYQISIYDK